jgi:5'-methylthioadenosine phosphorylase
MIENVKIGVIGGSGVYKLDNLEDFREVEVQTPFGTPSSPLMEGTIDGTKVVFIARHGKEHTILPHEVNYRANIYALKAAGVQYVFSVSAVGSLKEEYAPTHFVLPDQFIDWTKGQRERSFFGEGLVGHVSVAHPIEKKLQEVIISACQETQVTHHVGGSYICIEGPQFSSKKESEIYRSFGADIIGMTNVPEAYLAKEAGIAYATIAMVTDYDCWKEEHCTVDEIMKIMHKNSELVKDVLSHAIPSLSQNMFDFIKENQMAVMTPKEAMTEDQLNILKVLLS